MTDGTCEYVGIDEDGGMDPCDRPGTRERHHGLMWTFCPAHWREVRDADGDVATTRRWLLGPIEKALAALGRSSLT